MRRTILFIAVLSLIVFIVFAWLWSPKPDIRNFDPTNVASAEMAMWKAYYAGDQNLLAVKIVLLLRQEFHLSLYSSKQIASQLAEASLKFKTGEGNQDEIIMSVLESAYAAIKSSTGAQFDEKEAAKAELAWWAARRMPGQNSAERVGKKIAHLYGILFGSEKNSFEKAGYLRAKAAILRDSGGDFADWPQIESLLLESYITLKKALAE